MPNTSDLPFLPGNTFDFDKKPENFRKSHVFDYKKGVPYVSDEKPKVGGLKSDNEVATHTPRTSLDIYSRTADSSQKALPSWIVFDRKVLRFYAYFQESVNERREETFRVRKCNIYFYLEDDSIHVSEPRTANSGIPQGVLIARHRIPLPADEYGQHYTLTHLNVNSTVTFYGKTFKIIGCDNFTRDFMVKLQMQVPDNSSYPSDPYEQHRKELASRMVSTHHYDSIRGLKKFLEHDRHVLRFYCLWDDTLSMFGEARQMVLHYFLADDTVEIFERGDSRKTNFLRRGKLPKNFELNSEFYTDRDFTIGAILSIYGRKFIVCDSDAYTREYYQETYGVLLGEPLTFDDEEDGRVIDATKNIPPYNGYGSEEDSIGSCIALIPKPPRKDFKRLMAYDNVVLRFEARLLSDRPINKERKFIVCYYMADESIQVFESNQRNSGIVGGKFLERTKKLKKKTGNGYFTSQDFYLGSVIECFSHEFILEKADDYAISYMTAHPEQFPHSNLAYIMANLSQYKEQLSQHFGTGNSAMSISQFEQAIKQIVPGIPIHALTVVSQTYHKDITKFLSLL